MVVMTLVATASAVAANQHIRITYMVDDSCGRCRAGASSSWS